MSQAESQEEEGARPNGGLLRRIRVSLLYARRLLLKKLPPEEAQEVRAHVEEEGKFTERYALMCALSAAIATLGLLQGSAAVVIGAMLVSPLMSPIASLGFSIASLNARRTQEAARVVAIGAAVGVSVGMVITWLSPIRDATPEILARTEPTLLDLAIAVLSGLAGGYATVHRRGETAIGVAIATALMPPLATLGYGIAVWRVDYASGALLLFLANLAAIAFSFGVVARIRGVAWTFAPKRVRTRYAAIGVLVFLILATPLGLTLRRVTREAIASQATRAAVTEVMAADPSQIAQLNVKWDNFGPLQISVTVVTRTFVPNSERRLATLVEERIDAVPRVVLRQIVAADPGAHAMALREAARTPAPVVEPPPFDAVRAAARVRPLAVWANEEAHSIHLAAAPDELDLAALRAEEARLDGLGFGWRVVIMPAPRERLPLLFANGETELGEAQSAALDDIVWAFERWGVRTARVEGLAGRYTGIRRSANARAAARAEAVIAALAASEIAAVAEPAAREQVARLREEGAERLEAVDILPFAPVVIEETAEPVAAPAPAPPAE